MQPRATTLLITLLVSCLATPVAEARRERLALRHQSIELPAAPAVLLTHDLDGDGRRDLVALLAYTEWDQIGVSEEISMDDVDGLVEMLTIVPALTDRRELRVWLARDDGSFEPSGPPLPIDLSVLSLFEGPARLGVVALTDDGLSRLVLDGGQPRLEPVLDEPPVIAGTATLLPNLDLVHQLDGPDDVPDGSDLLLPTEGGLVLYHATAEGGLRRGQRLRLPFDGLDFGPGQTRYVPLPEVRDVDGDGRTDLLVAHPEEGLRRLRVLPNPVGQPFGEILSPLGGADDEEDGEKAAGDEEGEADSDDDESDDDESGSSWSNDDPVYFGDLDGDGHAELVTHRDLSDPDAGARQEVREAKVPPVLIRYFRTDDTLAPEPTPYYELEAIGYGFETSEGDDEGSPGLPGGFQDLDGDGRLDLVTITLDFSMLQAVRILATHRISIGIDFHLWCQNDEGGFAPVTGLDLSGKFRFDLDDLRIGQLSQFAGDFDGDGRADFIQLGRGKKVSIHRGADGCRYPNAPDLAFELEAPPRDLGLVQVRDLDGDALADLMVIQPQKVTEPGVTPPVRLDLYLSTDPSTDSVGARR